MTIDADRQFIPPGWRSCHRDRAAAGIGRSIAETFTRAGAGVVTDLRKDGADAVASAIDQAGGKAIGLECNVTDETHRVSVVDTATQTFGRISILVNNAGPKPFDMPLGDFEWAYELNVFSIFRLMQLVAPHMQKAGADATLNVSSMAGENKNIRMTSYGSSKAAANHLTRNVAFDLGPMDIRVNAIAPGAIKTDALAKLLTPAVEKLGERTSHQCARRRRCPAVRKYTSVAGATPAHGRFAARVAAAN